ncbi:MAG: site-specific integrase [Gammaproteobacteria bacterium]
MKTAALSLGPHLQAFFTEHLTCHKRVSPQTLASVRDSFRLLLQFLRIRTGIEPAALQVTDVDASAILAFLDHLEQHRANSVRSRNVRLAAIRTFFRYLALRDPDRLGQITQVMAIPVKRQEKKLIGALTREEMDALLAIPDRSTWTGRRDHALLLTMYNTGARVSEMTELRTQQVRFGATTYIELHGKGRKERTVPLWPHTGHVLESWFRELSKPSGAVAFPNARGHQMARDGVEYLLRKTVRKAASVCPSLAGKRISPHTLRHTTAMHLLQAGVDITVIALWLGHESIETTHCYVEADLATKQRALDRVAPVTGGVCRFQPDDALMAFLAAL